MLNPIEFSVGLNPNRRWLRSVIFIAIAVFAGSRFLSGRQQTPDIIAGIALVSLAAFGLLNLWRYRIIISESSVEQSTIFGRKRLMFAEVLQARDRRRVLQLIGPTQNIRIQPDVDLRDQVAAKVSAKLNALPTLQTNGNTSEWGIAERDDEGRLVRG